MEALGTDQTIYCPAFPENGRSIYMGNLFVGEQPLAESPMEDHPLTPMRDSNLMRLLEPQVTRPVGLVDRLTVEPGAEALRAELARLKDEGKIGAIGVSNFLPGHLDQLAETATVVPSINQIEFHPHLQSPELVAYCEAHNIVLEAWSPLKAGRIVDDPELQMVADVHGVTVPQVVLRWMLQRGVVAIPKSVSPSNRRIQPSASSSGDMPS